MKGKKNILYSLIIMFLFFGFAGGVNAEVVCCKTDGTIFEGLKYGNANEESICYNSKGDWTERNQCRKICCDLNTGNEVSYKSGKCEGEDRRETSASACQRTSREYLSIGGDAKCVDKDVKDLLKTIKDIYVFMKYIAPAILVVMGSVDFMRATISSNADDMEKNKKRFFNRLGLAALVFLAFAIVQLIMNLLTVAEITNGSSWIDCWNTLIIK